VDERRYRQDSRPAFVPGTVWDTAPIQNLPGCDRRRACPRFCQAISPPPRANPTPTPPQRPLQETSPRQPQTPQRARFTRVRSTADTPFTAPERDLIRLEMGMRFGQYPELANGLFLRTWRAGPHKGEPKIPKAIQSMLDRGLVEIRPNPMGRQAAFFTDAGLKALRQLL
jgi:hypothetical protein